MVLTKKQKVERAIAIGYERLEVFNEQLNVFYSELEACQSLSLYGNVKLEPIRDIFSEIKDQVDIIKYLKLAAETSEMREFKRHVDKASDKKIVADKIYASLEQCQKILHWIDNDSDDARQSTVAKNLDIIEKVRMDMGVLEVSVELRQEVRDMYRRLRELERRSSNLDESGTAAALSRSMSTVEIHGPNPQYGRWDNSLLPSFDGTDTDYSNFKQVFKDLCSGYGFSDQRLSLMLCMEKVITNAELRKQVSAIRDHSEQWSFLDQMFLSNTRRFMRILTKLNKMKPVDKPTDIVSAIATFKSTLQEVESIVGSEAKDYNQLTLIHIFKDKVPEVLKDKIMMELGSMNSPDIKKIVDLLEKTRGAMLAGDMSYDAGASRRFRDRAAAAQVTGRSDNKNARAGKDKNSKWNSACFVEGCKDKHPIFRCHMFKKLDVVDRKKIVQQRKLCELCLCDGHVAEKCDKKDKLGICGTNNCDRHHSRLLHEASASVNTVYKSSSAPSPCTFLLQLVPVVVPGGGTYHAAVMFDSGANLPLVSEKLSNQLKLKPTGRYTTISVADGSESRCPNVVLHLKDRDGNLREFEAAVMPSLGGANEMRSVHPETAAEIFKMPTDRFTYVSGGLDVIIGNTHPDVFPSTYQKVGQSMLWRTIFGSGYICTSADGGAGDQRSVYKAVSVSGGNLPDFLTSESFGVQPQALCPGCTACQECKAMADGSTWDQRERQRIIEAGLTLDLQSNKWTGQYAYIEDPHTLPYNESLARKIAEKDRARMVKEGTYDLYVEVFNDAIARGVFQKATPEELNYSGPKSFSSIVVAYKEDSSVVLSQIVSNSAMLNTFNAHRIGEIQSATNKDDWRWLPGSHNVADLGTRSTCKVSDLGPGSRYRLGPDWLRQDESTWPVKTAEQVKQELPPEELNTKMVKLCAMQATGEAAEDIFRFKHRRSFGQAKRIMAIVLQVSNTWLKKLKSRQGDKVAAAGDTVYKPSLYNFMAAAELFIVSRSQQDEWINDAKGKYASLNPVEHQVSLTWPVVGPGGKYVSREIRVLRMVGRGEPAIDAITGGRKMLFQDMRGLVILEPNNWLASVIMRDAHVELHSGVRGTLAESRRYAWIVKARRLSIMEVKKCWACSLERAKECRVTMKDVLPDRLVPSRPFEAVQVDLMGPLVTRRATAKTRSQKATKKVWVFVVVCRFSGALWLDALEKYDTSSILLSLRKLEAVHCLPKMIVSDMGTQLSAARKTLEKTLGSQVEFSWSQIPARAHHFVGQAEKMVGLTKRLLSKKLTNTTVNFNELLVLLAEVSKIMNSRPLTVEAANDAENWRLITPGQLLGNVDRQPLCNVAMNPEDQISCRLKLIEDLSAQFWSSYRQEVLPKLLRMSKWREEMAEPLARGDIVLVTSTNPLMRCLRLGRVTEIEEGRKTARVLFRLTDKSPLEEHPVSVRQLLKIMIKN